MQKPSDLTSITLIPQAEITRVCSTLSRFFKIISVPKQNLSPTDTLTIKNEFTETARNGFFCHLAQNHPEKLRDLGVEGKLDEYELALIKTARSDIPRNVSRLGYNVDHIIPIGFGGRNDYRNLVLLPKKLHKLKNMFETAAELLSLPPTDTLITLAPVGFSKGSHSPIIIGKDFV